MTVQALSARQLKKATFLFCVIIFSLLFSNCKKDSSNQAVSSSTKVSPDASGTITTPEGPMPSSSVHLLESGYHLSFQNGHVYKIHTQSGKLAEDFGEIKRSVTNNNRFQHFNRPAGGINTNGAAQLISPPSGNGWVTWAEWGNTNGQPINYFSTSWLVPSAPTTNDGQLIFIWNGLEPFDVLLNNPNNMVLQPVLQWGSNNTFGGQYWVISNWCVWNGGAAYTTPQSVGVGTNLQGVLTYTGRQADGSYNYLCSFTGYSNSMNITEGNVYANHTIPNIPLQSWAYEVLEVLNVPQQTDYPGQSSVTMGSISLQTGPPGVYTPAALNWTPEIQSAISTLGESTTIYNNNSTGTGQVGLFFHTPPVITGATVVNGIATLYSAVPTATGTITAEPGEQVSVVVSTFDKDPAATSTITFTIPTAVTVRAGSNPTTVTGSASGVSKTLTFVMPANTTSVTWNANYSQVGGSTHPYDGANIRVY